MTKKMYNDKKEAIDKKDEYVKSLEKEIEILSMNREKYYTPEKEKLEVLLKKQEEFLIQQYKDKDNLLSENKRLSQEIARLTRTIQLNHQFINYLANSFWWKLTLPMRVIYRKFKNKPLKYNFVTDILSSDDSLKVVEQKVSILIFTYNAGEEFSVQLDNLTKQKLINDIEIIVIDRGSVDNTLTYAKEYGAKIVDIKDCSLTDSEIYEKILPTVSGEYVVMIDQNKVVDSKYWIYQSLLPIMDGMAVSTVFFNEDVSDVKNSSYYQELKSRMTTIAGEQVLFFPENRNVIQCFSPFILDKSCILVKKKVSNLFLV